MSRRLATSVAAGTAVTVLGVVPSFLTGALGVVLRPALGLSAVQLGALVATFWAAASLVAVPAGIVMRRLSGRGAMVVAALATTLGAVTVACSRSGVAFALGMALAGAASALCQLAAAKFLAGAVEPGRMGLALGVKQAALPAATLVGGLAVPLAVGSLEWPVLYAALSVAGLALALVLWPRGGSLLESRAGARAARAPKRALGTALLFAVVAGLASVGATGMSVFIVEFVDESVGGASVGGYMLAAGSALAVTVRVGMGALVDKRRVAPTPAITTMLAVGAGAALAMPLHLAPWLVLLVVALLYGVGWGWSGLVVYLVVRRAHDDVAAATGTMQTGVWIGSVAGPLAVGAVIDARGFGAAWALVAVSLGAAALVLAVAARLSHSRRRGADPSAMKEVAPSG